MKLFQETIKVIIIIFFTSFVFGFAFVISSVSYILFGSQQHFTHDS